MKSYMPEQSLNKAINNKLASRSGESIAETMVAVLISALALVMLAGSITAASSMIKTSRDKLDKYYAANEVLAKMDSTSADGVTTDNSGSITITEDSTRISSSFTYNVKVYTNSVFKNKEVKEYKVID